MASALQWLALQQLRKNQHEIKEAKRRLSSQWEVAAQQLNWRNQLCNGWGGSNNNNNNCDNDDNNDTETATVISSITAAGTVYSRYLSALLTDRLALYIGYKQTCWAARTSCGVKIFAAEFHVVPRSSLRS